MDQLYDEVPQDLACSAGEKAHIGLVKFDCEANELGCFVVGRCGWKANKKWLSGALDRASRQVIALFIGDRSAGALGLWQALPERYREKVAFYSANWHADKRAIPDE